MRPVKLEIKGFTSFRDEQVVDFDGLDLFAIVGPTGSGKSSVLDAMTYALFGQVDRVDGSETPMREMVSQGQPRMAVALEFEVGADRYRVTRSMPRSGATRILLQRWEGGEWRQAGEGADRVRDANRKLQDLIGLDFDGFTRSVLLPQGKFSAFMSGDAKERRDILTDLLGLSLFDRMGKRARQVAKESKEKADTVEELIESQFAGATPEALDGARRAAQSVAERRDALTEAGERVRGIVDRWRAVAKDVADLRSCASEAAGLARTAARHAETLEALAAAAAKADRGVTDAETAAAAAGEARDAAGSAREAAEREWGTAADLARAHAEAVRLALARGELQRRRGVLEQAERAVPESAAAVEEAERALDGANAESERLRSDHGAAAAALEDVRHADQVSAMVSNLAVGDPCPVCGEPLAKLPDAPGAKAMKAAERGEAGSRTAAEAAARAAGEAERALDRARAAMQAAERERDAAAGEAERCGIEVAGLEAAIGRLLPEAVDDPAAELASRSARLEGLVRAERDAEATAAAADRAAQEARGARERIRGDAGASRAGLDGISVASLAERASAIAPDLEAPALPDLPASEDIPALAVSARLRADALARYGGSVEGAATDRAASEGAFVDEARGAVTGLGIEPGAPDGLDGLAADVDRAVRDAVAEASARQGDAERLELDLARVAELREQVRTLRARAAVFRQLAQELQADRLIAFLQAEALRLLAVDGARRLSALSSGRYALEYDHDEFLVLDRWNGDETRSVRTLSGGETFLASLALALALAEQVSSLAVTEHASLDSLFLDEGFGTLDPETLDVVVEAIEQLGGDGRMVGVITHVRDLADRLPARLEVTKSPRGSTVSRAV